MACPELWSKYPFMSRRLPAWSVIGVIHALSDVHVTVAVVAAPVSSFSASGVLRLAPVALFQFVFATTPALSLAPIEVPLPTKLTPMTPGAAARGTGKTAQR